MKYNSKMKPLALPEYGRNVQNMVDHCLAIEDRDKRNICARTIIKTMKGMTPELKDNNQSDKIYWDHLAIMSDFNLDVDFPENTITKEKLIRKPSKIEYPNHKITYRYYGNLIDELIEKACNMEEGEERNALSELIAKQMKRSYMAWNKDNIDDSKIFSDLYDMSKGKIHLNIDNCKLTIPNTPEKRDNKRIKKYKRK